MSDPLPCPEQMVAIELVRGERIRQDAKWGSNRRLPDERWLTILTEEVGEAAKALLDGEANGLSEVVQIAAVALAWIEMHVREDASEQVPTIAFSFAPPDEKNEKSR